MIVAANHVGDLHLSIVDDNHVVVNGNPGRSHDDRIADRFIVESDVPAYDVMKVNRVLGNLQQRRASGEAAAIRLKIPEHPIHYHDIARVDGTFYNNSSNS